MKVKAVVATGYVKRGKLTVRHRQRLVAALARWKDCDVIVTVEKAHATRSLEQNSLYWAGYVEPVAEYTGNSAMWVHGFFKKRFLPKQQFDIVDPRTGEVLDTDDLDQPTTTVLNKVEFSEYLNAIEEWTLDTFHGLVTVGSDREHAA
jgi:hypothetical protein